jgi:hypothetical protein
MWRDYLPTITLASLAVAAWLATWALHLGPSHP